MQALQQICWLLHNVCDLVGSTAQEYHDHLAVYAWQQGKRMDAYTQMQQCKGAAVICMACASASYITDYQKHCNDILTLSYNRKICPDIP